MNTYTKRLLLGLSLALGLMVAACDGDDISTGPRLPTATATATATATPMATPTP